MSIYDPLKEWLVSSPHQITLSFEEIQRIVGEKLPKTAFERPQWWAADSTHTQAKAWLSAGWTAHPKLETRTVTFRKRSN